MVLWDLIGLDTGFMKIVFIAGIIIIPCADKEAAAYAAIQEHVDRFLETERDRTDGR
jgi:hypothetical protein